MKLLTILTAIFAAFWYCPLCYAEPSKSIERLMNAPTSLFSFGLFRLDEYVQKNVSPESSFSRGTQFEAYKYFASSDYDWGTNSINVRVFSYHAKFDPVLLDYEAECDFVIGGLRGLGYVNRSTGKFVLSDMEYSQFASFFFPLGYGIKELSSEIGKDIDKKIVLHFSSFLMKDDNGNYERKIYCTGSLLDSSYTSSKAPVP